MDLAQDEPGEDVGFQVVCGCCGSLSIRMTDPLKSTASTLVQCRGCNAVRGTLGELQDLARSATDVFEF
jgi:hypothetical protein